MKNSYDCAPPAIELIYTVEKHNTLITKHFPDLGFANKTASTMTARSTCEDFT